MTVNLRPETEKLVAEEISQGHFHTLDDLIIQGLHAWREKHHMAEPPAWGSKKNFAQFLLDSPLPGSGLKLDREKDDPRPVDL